MTSDQKQKANQHNHGMSNAAVLVIGVLVGLIGAGAFIFVANQAGSKTATSSSVVSEVPAAEQTKPVAAESNAKTAAAVDSVVEQKADSQEKAKPLTADEIKQVQQVKQILDKAIANETQKVVNAVKSINEITGGKNVMSLSQAKLQELSSKVKLVIDAETNFINALQNVDDALVKLVNKTTLSAPNKLRTARAYMYNLSIETALPFRKANLDRWGAYQKFVDFLGNNYGKWEFDAQKKNTKLLDESLNEALKITVTNLNEASKALKTAEAKHVQVIRSRIAQLQKVREAAKAVGTAATSESEAVTTGTSTQTDKAAQ